MVKILLASLVTLLVVSGAVGAAAVAAKRIDTDEPLNVLRTWRRQLAQEQGEMQEQEQLQIRIEAGQPESSLEMQVQNRLRLENQEMLQTQNRIQIQEQIQLRQTIRLQSGMEYQWGIESSGYGNSYGPGTSDNPMIPQTGIGIRKQQGGKP